MVGSNNPSLMNNAWSKDSAEVLIANMYDYVHNAIAEKIKH